MDIQFEKQTPVEALIKIKLKEDDYQSKYEEKIKEYRKQASLKGFRPGKVPTGLIKKMYGTSILVEQINKILIDAMNNYIKENDLKIIGDPLPNNEKAEAIDWGHAKEFDFEYQIGMIDDFKYDLEATKATKFEIKIDKAELDKIFEGLKKQYGKMTNPEVSEEGDTIFGTLVQESTDFSLDTMLYPDQILKKHLKKTIGIKKDESISFDIQGLFKNDDDLAQFTQKTPEEAKNLKDKFTFTVKNINRTEPAEMNQEFFDKIFGKDQVKTEKEFIEKYTEMVSENYDKESGFLLSSDLQKKLIESVKVELPENFYKKWILAANKEIKEADLEKDFEHYTRDLKWNLIKNRISDENSIKVEFTDVLERTKEFFRQQYGLYNTGGTEAEKSLEILANNYLQENEGEQYRNIHSQVNTEKIMDLVKEKAKISVKKISHDDFNKKVK